MKVQIVIHLKPDIPDAPGRVVTQRLVEMGYQEVRDAKIGKVIELDLDTGDEFVAQDRVRRMCEELLANTVVEDFTVRFFDN